MILRGTILGGLLALALVAGCNRKPDPAVIRAGFAAADFATAEQPLLIADFRDRDRVGLLGFAGVNGPVQVWRSGDGVGISMDHGVLVRVAGVGQNLLIADPAPTKAALAGQGPAVYGRVYKTLTADNQIDERLLTCRMTPAGLVSVPVAGRPTTASEWRETCSSASVSIMNRYWTIPGRGIVKSDEWIPGNGYLTVDVPLAIKRSLMPR